MYQYLYPYFEFLLESGISKEKNGAFLVGKSYRASILCLQQWARDLVTWVGAPVLPVHQLCYFKQIPLSHVSYLLNGYDNALW